mmetsp:Transcript_6386/g.22782  ORF Transcript_6386/g.22782 Transcript_6386/m.22782 type:complete len:215 (+) Transcript_6386:2538-3182(+)
MLSQATSLILLLSSSLLTFSSEMLLLVSSTRASPSAMILFLSSASMTISSLAILSSSGAPEFFSRRKSSWALIWRILSRISFFFTALSALFISWIDKSRTSSNVLTSPASTSSPSRSYSFFPIVNRVGGPDASSSSNKLLASSSTVPLQLAQASKPAGDERHIEEHPPCQALKARRACTVSRSSPDRSTIFPPSPPEANRPASPPPAMCSTTLS